jgi:capsule synthesis protein PGA_cap
MRSPVSATPWIAASICLLGGAAVALIVAGAPSPSSAAPGARPPPAPPRAPVTVTLVAGGDVALAGEPNSALFAHIRRFLEPADLAVANLEGTLATGGSARCVADANAGCFIFRASPRWAATLKGSGFTALNVANNHALDYGQDAQAETLAALRREHLAFDGLPGQITYVRAGRARVALVGCAPYRWAQNLLDLPGTAHLVKKASHRADVVIVYMHAGAEGSTADHVSGSAESYLGEPRGNPAEFAHAMIDAGADLVLASGPHVLRGMEWYRGRLIAYSLGNLASSHTLSSAGVLAQSALLRVTLDVHGRFVAGSLIPLRLDAWGTPAFDPGRASLGLLRSLSRTDFAARALLIGAGGKLTRPALRRTPA